MPKYLTVDKDVYVRRNGVIHRVLVANAPVDESYYEGVLNNKENEFIDFEKNEVINAPKATELKPETEGKKEAVAKEEVSVAKEEVKEDPKAKK